MTDSLPHSDKENFGLSGSNDPSVIARREEGSDTELGHNYDIDSGGRGKTRTKLQF